MDFERVIESAQQDIIAAKKKLDNIQDQLKAARTFTAQFLAKCKDSGIDKVSICRKHKSIPGTMDWPFGHEGSVFSNDVEEKSGWPAIWRVVTQCGIAGSCGNVNQHDANTAKLIDGVYHLSKGKWQRVD